MKSKLKISLDLDSTLCGFSEAWNAWLYKTGRTKELLFTEEVSSYDFYTKHICEDAKKFFLDNPSDCYKNIEPYPGAVDFINYCKEKYEYVEILTHSDNSRTSSAKINYCINNFDFYNVQFTDKVSEKYKHSADKILVDDYPTTIIKHASYNKSPGILFNLYQKFGWSRLKDYKHEIEEHNPDMKYINSAYSYGDVIRQLERIEYDYDSNYY